MIRTLLTKFVAEEYGFDKLLLIQDPAARRIEIKARVVSLLTDYRYIWVVSSPL